MCALGSIVFASNATDTHHKLLSLQYGVDEDMLESERNLFFHDSEKQMKSVSDVLEVTKASGLSTN